MRAGTYCICRAYTSTKMSGSHAVALLHAVHHSVSYRKTHWWQYGLRPTTVIAVETWHLSCVSMISCKRRSSTSQRQLKMATWWLHATQFHISCSLYSCVGHASTLSSCVMICAQQCTFVCQLMSSISSLFDSGCSSQATMLTCTVVLAWYFICWRFAIGLKVSLNDNYLGSCIPAESCVGMSYEYGTLCACSPSTLQLKRVSS